METSSLTIIILLFIGAYLLFYFSGRVYLENFQGTSEGGPRFHPDGSPIEKVQPPEKPYLMDPIDNIDTYEMSAVFQNQGSKEASKRQLSNAMTRYPLDWSTQGPNSQYFQEEQAKYAQQSSPPPSDDIYKNVDGSKLAIVKDESQDEEEKKVLQMYKPESSKGLLRYSVDDVKGLLHKVYDKKGLIPVVEKSKQGENIWEIVEVKEKNPKIVWEDGTETTVDREKMERRGEQVIEVPTAASDMAAGLDPFFQPRVSTHNGKSDYTSWTPGLERMFAPTYPEKTWF